MMKELTKFLDAVLDQLGVVRKTARPLLDPRSQFDQDVVETVAFHKRRMGIDRRIANNTDMLGGGMRKEIGSNTGGLTSGYRDN